MAGTKFLRGSRLFALFYCRYIIDDEAAVVVVVLMVLACGGSGGSGGSGGGGGDEVMESIGVVNRNGN